MKYTKMALHLVFAALAAAFLTACAGMQTDGESSGYSDYSGGYGGHGGHH